MSCSRITTLLTFFTSISTSIFTNAQSLSSSNTFVLYPYITSGSLTGPYPNSAIDKSQPLSTSSGRESGTWTSDCFNRFVFTSYIGTHCYGQDQCGFRRWSLNDTNPNSDYSSTLETAIVTFSGMLISHPDDMDELGRRDVGWTNGYECDSSDSVATSGLSIRQGSEGVFHLQYDNVVDDRDEFGTFLACWLDGELYGPRLFYRNADGVTPDGCAELLLVPRCTNDTALAKAPIITQCYQGGLPP